MNYHNITYPDMNNGSGLRVVLWLSGCSHKCKSCQNPQTWDKNSGILFDNIAEEELFEALSKDYISGITFSGGDPLHENNISEVLSFVNEIKLSFPEKTIWLYSGYSFAKFFQLRNYEGVKLHLPYSCHQEIEEDKIRREIISKCDVMVDGRYVDELRDISLKWRGSSNQNVINVQESIKQEKLILYCD